LRDSSRSAGPAEFIGDTGNQSPRPSQKDVRVSGDRERNMSKKTKNQKKASALALSSSKIPNFLKVSAVQTR
jgi:hypothetical protein